MLDEFLQLRKKRMQVESDPGLSSRPGLIMDHIWQRQELARKHDGGIGAYKQGDVLAIPHDDGVSLVIVPKGSDLHFCAVKYSSGAPGEPEGVYQAGKALLYFAAAILEAVAMWAESQDQDLMDKLGGCDVCQEKLLPAIRKFETRRWRVMETSVPNGTKHE